MYITISTGAYIILLFLFCKAVCSVFEPLLRLLSIKVGCTLPICSGHKVSTVYRGGERTPSGLPFQASFCMGMQGVYCRLFLSARWAFTLTSSSVKNNPSTNILVLKGGSCDQSELAIVCADLVGLLRLATLGVYYSCRKCHTLSCQKSTTMRKKTQQIFQKGCNAIRHILRGAFSHAKANDLQLA